jgi:predicted nuclease of restriction endonuclease-like (RecB) superfamily
MRGFEKYMNQIHIAADQNFTAFVKDIKSKILSSQYEALKAVNKELINLYWDIGKNIAEKQEKFGWGKSVVKTLSEELQKEFVGIKGFSVQNLWNMRQFYLEYYENEKLQPLVGEISWTKNVIIFQKCKDSLEREFYIKTSVPLVSPKTHISFDDLLGVLNTLEQKEKEL